MPATEGCGKGMAPYNAIAPANIGKSFVIHEARTMVDDSNKESRIFCVSFIGSDGEIIPGVSTTNAWITYIAMNSIITHNYKRKKFVYDQTIIRQSLCVQDCAAMQVETTVMKPELDTTLAPDDDDSSDDDIPLSALKAKATSESERLGRGQRVHKPSWRVESV